MKSTWFYAVLTFGVLLMAVIAWFGLHHSATTPKTTSPFVAPLPTSSATSSPSLTGLSIYTNGVYGFSIFYPGQYPATTTFDMQYHLPNTWRVNATPASGTPAPGTSTPVFQITRYSVTNAHSFPRYFEAEVRIGASSVPADISACLKPSNGEVQKPDTVINGLAWKTFAFQDAGMMQYLSGISYRTVHDKTCIALEQLETGSSYTDTPNSADIPQATLDGYYNDLSVLTKSFSFARP